MNIKIKSTKLFLLFLLLFLLFVIFSPFLVIWSVNTLLGLSIAYSWKNWCAIFLLYVIAKMSVKYDPK